MQQLRMFDRALFVGKSKCYQDTINMLRTLKNMKANRGYTAYELASMMGYSARHLNRVLIQALGDGNVDFNAVVRRGKPAREWFSK